MKVKEIPLDQILLPETPVRQTFSEEAGEQLIDSMRKYGLFEPLVVMQEGEMYRLVAGFRRYNAAMALGWEKIACNIINVDPQTGALISLEENIKREEVNPYEEALYFSHLIRNYKMTQTEIAERFGYSKQQVHNRMMLLQLDPTTVQMVQEGDLGMTHALELGRIADVEVRARVRAEVQTREMTTLATRYFVDQVVALGPEVTQKGEVSIENIPVEEAPVGHYKCHFCEAPGRDVVLDTLFICRPCKRALEDAKEAAEREAAS